MKPILAALFITSAAFGQNLNPPSEGPVYNPKGQMIEYHYADGTKESYTYDGWRMIRFTDRGGGVTTFRYLGDGSMVTVMPDGTTR